MHKRNKDSVEFRLTLATTNNHVYHVCFDKFYLKKEETIFIEKSDPHFIIPVLAKQDHPNT